MTFVSSQRAAEIGREMEVRKTQFKGQKIQAASPVLRPLPVIAVMPDASQTSQIQLRPLEAGQAEPVSRRFGEAQSVQRIQLNVPATFPAGHDPEAVQAVAAAAPFGGGLDEALVQDPSYKGLPNLIEAFYPGARVRVYSSSFALFETPAGQLSLARLGTSDGGLRLSATHVDVSALDAAQSNLIDVLYPNSTLVKENDRVRVFVTEDGRPLIAQIKLNPEAMLPEAEFLEMRLAKDAYQQFVLDSAERLKAIKQQGHEPTAEDLYLPEGFHPF